MTTRSAQSWQALSTHCQSFYQTHLRDLFAEEKDRASRFSRRFDGLLYDFSKQRLNQETLDRLVHLAEANELRAKIERMFQGELINETEKRAVLHTALRSSEKVFPSAAFNVMPDILKTKERMAAFAENLRSGSCLGAQKLPIKTIINIGIGGSDLGPKMMAYALRAKGHPVLDVHYVSNLDGAQLAPLLQTLDPRTTLFIIVSKTFTTQETMINANTARAWLSANLGKDFDPALHFAAVSSRVEKTSAFGISPDRVFPIWDWVGGRYSLWSAVGLALMIEIGAQAFFEVLEGAERMDRHFRTAPFIDNLPVLMALIGIWNTNLLGAHTLALLPYNESLRYFPSFMQQLEMESNGKSTCLNGMPTQKEACPIVWGELGNNGQHAFFQLLHQGGRLTPCDFIAAVRSDFPLPNHQEALLANCFAQSAALAFGKNEEEVLASLKEEGLPEDEIKTLLPHRVFAGNQPSSTILLESLNPKALGSLIALYEHKVFVQGILWEVNSFDQWGVELGKAMAGRILPAMTDAALAKTLDASTQSLLAYTHQHL